MGGSLKSLSCYTKAASATSGTTATSATVAATSIANLGWDKARRIGKALRVHTGSKVRRFPLAGIDPALSLLSACAAKHRSAKA